MSLPPLGSHTLLCPAQSKLIVVGQQRSNATFHEGGRGCDSVYAGFRATNVIGSNTPTVAEPQGTNTTQPSGSKTPPPNLPCADSTLVWFATPFKASKKPTKFKQGTKFPVPTHLVLADRRPSDNNLAAVIELLAEASMHEAMLQAHETIKVTVNIDEIIDEKGVPIPPANMTDPRESRKAGRRPRGSRRARRRPTWIPEGVY